MKINKLFLSLKHIDIILLLCMILLSGCGGGGDAGSESNVSPGYLTLSYFPFEVGDAYKYRSVDGSDSSIYLTEVDTISVTNSDFLISYQDSDGTYGEVIRVENNIITVVSSTDSSTPQGLLPHVLYDLSINENETKTIGTKSNLLFEDIDDDGIQETITSWTVTQTLLPRETTTVENIIFSDCAKIKTSINSLIKTSLGTDVSIQSIIIEWYASSIGLVKSTSELTVTGPGGSISYTDTDELLKYVVSGIEGGDWAPPEITANATQLTNQLHTQIIGVTENGATVTATTDVASVIATADISGDYLIDVPLESNKVNEISVTAADFVKNEKTTIVSVTQDSDPPTPVAATVLQSNGSVNLSWGSSADASGIAEYRIVSNSIPIGATPGTSWSDSSVNPGEQITYIVLAVDNAGNISIASPLDVSVPPGGTGTFNTQYQLSWPADIGTIQNLSVVDVDNDGNRDVIAFSDAGSVGRYILTSLGPTSETSTFSKTIFTPNEGFVTTPFLVDVNNDSRPEILSSRGGINDGPLVLRWDMPTELWTKIPQTWSEYNIYYDTFGDIDGDGILDLLGIKLVDDSVINGFEAFIYRGIGDGMFNDIGEVATGIISSDWSNVSNIRTTDFNRDGKIDIIFWDDDNLSIFLGQGSGSYSLSNTLPVFSCNYFRCNYLVADISGDGFPDIIYDDVPGSPRDTRVFINDGTGHFPVTSVATNIGDSLQFATGDLNGDAIPDLIVANGGQTVTIWWSAGDGSFTIGPIFIVSYFDKVLTTDIDRDGDVDVVAYGSPGGCCNFAEINIFLNE